ncbi:MAG: glycosyltransferase [Treponema sp.]|nr:glycosyltransferase [Treponema sp.]
MNVKFSVVIPVRAINDFIREAFPHLINIDYPDYEVLIFPDELPDQSVLDELSNPRVRIIASGKTGPAQKRDMAMKYATGNVFAFIDDDAFPRQDWLKNAEKWFGDDGIGAVGGPAVTPENVGLLERAGGIVLASPLCSGGYVRRYIPKKLCDDDDIPSVNLIVRRDVFEGVNGFDSNYYPGEDTKLCLDITDKAKKRIVYDPNILVYHHRRPIFRKHLKQISNYARHRGFFMKKLPKTSLRPAYLLPLLFLLGIILGPVVSHFFPVCWYIYASVLGLYALLDFATTFSARHMAASILAFFALFLTHMTYGIFTIVGLFQKKLTR